MTGSWTKFGRRKCKILTYSALDAISTMPKLGRRNRLQRAVGQKIAFYAPKFCPISSYESSGCKRVIEA